MGKKSQSLQFFVGKRRMDGIGSNNIQGFFGFELINH
jgi:hypothetical protein